MLELVKEVIQEYISKGYGGLFDNPNITGDPMKNLFECDDVIVKLCKKYEYFEVYGLSDGDFKELKKFYGEIRQKYLESIEAI